jgi:hypothetical protein
VERAPCDYVAAFGADVVAALGGRGEPVEDLLRNLVARSLRASRPEDEWSRRGLTSGRRAAGGQHCRDGAVEPRVKIEVEAELAVDRPPSGPSAVEVPRHEQGAD